MGAWRWSVPWWGIGLVHVFEELDREVVALAGERYARKGGRRRDDVTGVTLAPWVWPASRSGSRSHEFAASGRGFAGRSYEAFRVTVRSTRPCSGACCTGSPAATTRQRRSRSPGRSGCRVRRCRGFMPGQCAALREFQERDLSGEDLVAVFLDGKTFAGDDGHRSGDHVSGESFLGFVETDTENAKVLTPFLRSLRTAS